MAINVNNCTPGCKWTKPQCSNTCQIKFQVRRDKKNQMSNLKNELRHKNKTQIDLKKDYSGIEKSPCIGCFECDNHPSSAGNCMKMNDFVAQDNFIRVIEYTHCPKCGSPAVKSGKTRQVDINGVEKITQRYGCKNHECDYHFTKKSIEKPERLRKVRLKKILETGDTTEITGIKKGVSLIDCIENLNKYQKVKI